ncbi:MAG: chemotaxis protein CheA [Nitrospirae bacterium]|nr:MAG: chemotaxis protein CheA [Nitrospirota bacterium]
MNEEMREILEDFLSESTEMLEALDRYFVHLESDPGNIELLNEIFRCIHSMKGSAGFLGFTRLVEVTHQAENVLNKLRQGEMVVSQSVIDIILESVDCVKALYAAIRETGEDSRVEVDSVVQKLTLTLEAAQDLASAPSRVPPTDSVPDPVSPTSASSDSATVCVSAAPPASAQTESASATIERSSPMHAPASQEAPTDGSPATADDASASSLPQPGLAGMLEKLKAATARTAEAAQQKAKPSGTREDELTVRVETRRLDHVMNLVGELVLNRNRLMKLGYGLEAQHENDPVIRELGLTLAQLNLVTTDLQLAVMKTRMVPVRKVFARFPRLVRDLASKLKKQVRLEVVGEETEVDKSVADELIDPLVHLVRNAMDHGLETPVERAAQGKGPEGLIRLTAAQEGNSIVIRVEDDGRGLQVEKIKAKALAKGLVTEGDVASMSPREIMNVIFLPGFSTADQVSDVSGRGVGMDVVRTNISRMNGSIELDSQPGLGSLVTIKLPLTVAIIQALMVEVERSTFAIPLASVIEAHKVTNDEIKTINGQAVLNLRDRILPLLYLAEQFHLPHNSEAQECYVVVVAVGERRFGVVVDQLRAQEEVVIKSLGDFLTDVPGVAGATITGDGKVVLILDMADLVQEVRSTSMTMLG